MAGGGGAAGPRLRVVTRAPSRSTLRPGPAMQTHLKIVALLNIGFGILLAVLGSLLTLGLGLAGIASGDLLGGLVLGTAGVVGGLLLVLLALPQVIGGVGLLAQRNWARWLLIVTSVIGLFKFPVGTVLSVYALWVLLHDETRLAMRA
jgi:hypothetical protein